MHVQRTANSERSKHSSHKRKTEKSKKVQRQTTTERGASYPGEAQFDTLGV